MRRSSFRGCPRQRRLKLLILRLTPLGLVLPRDFSLRLAAISINMLRNQDLRLSGGKGRLCGQSAPQYLNRVYER